MDLDEDAKKQIKALSNQISQSLVGKTLQIGLESLAVALFNTMLKSGYSEKNGYDFLDSLLRDWKAGYLERKKRTDAYFKETEG